ncbi:MAG TPA: hypothetical protein PKH77_01430 [Anaerolineae bacterium]|nr:hypothetical protein [Anaerolineae bacterium]
MSDDLYDVMGGGGNPLFDDEEEEVVEQPQQAADGEGQNRMFYIIAGGMALALVCAIIAFGYWLLVANPKMQANQIAAMQTATAQQATVVGEPGETPPVEEATPTPEVEPTTPPTDTPTPTATPTLTPTPIIGPTNTPEVEGTPGEGAEVTAAGTEGDVTPTPTTRARRTDTPTPTSPPSAAATARPAATRATGGASTEKVPDTGAGEVALVLGAVALLVVLFTARKLRRA